MGRKSLGPRLWFRPDRHHSTRGNLEPGKWMIRDGQKMVSTGFGEDQRAQAETALHDYVAKTTPQKSYFVYFISAAAADFPIKIGISQSRHIRFASLQNALPYDLEILALMPTEDPLLERRLHRQFAGLRLKGEWFRRTPELMAYIELACLAGKAA